MTLKVAINGFGRIGRNFMRCWLSRGSNTGIEIVGQINEKRLVTDSRPCAQDCMPKAQRFSLSNINTGNAGRDYVLDRLEQLILAA